MADVSARLHLYTFPPESPFVEQLAALIAREPPEALVLVPSRRAAAALREACLRRMTQGALLLPRIQPVGDVDEHALWLEEWSATAPAEDAPPPVMAPLARVALLARLVQKSDAGMGMEQALLLAQELARLLDEVQREELSFDNLAELVPHELAGHWQVTVDFLRIVTEHWPRMLKERGREEPVRRRNLLLHALARQWRASPPSYPVIAAGSTGSQPATAALLKTIASLPQGKVILPGLDLAMPEALWRDIGETHPQFGLKQLLADWKVERAAVQRLDMCVAAACPPERIRLLAAAFAPASGVAAWPQAMLDKQALNHVTRLDCDTLQEEALTVALILRETLETPGKTALLVTEDRTLARMVRADLARMGVEVDDSAGGALSATLPGIFLRLVLELAEQPNAAVPLLATLKHPLCATGLAPERCRRTARALERETLRGVRLQGGPDVLERAMRNKDIAPELRTDITALLACLKRHAMPLAGALRKPRARFGELLKLHLALAEALAETADERGEARLWRGAEGGALAEAMAALTEAGDSLGEIDPRHYSGTLLALMDACAYRKPYGGHPRLRIVSPQEARLLQADRVILAGLNEESWPAPPAPSPWMSRPMRARFGLSAPERAIGQSAHDFWMLWCAPELFLTRAARVNGAPTEPSRWLTRLDTLLHAMTGAPWQWPESPYPAWARMREETPLAPLSMPAPRPPVASRPRRLRVTDVDSWLADPYRLYAKYILGLRKLEPLDKQPDRAEFGNVVHDALKRFAEMYPQRLPENLVQALLDCGRQAFAKYKERPAVEAFWWPRFEAIACWVAEQEQARRAPGLRILAEQARELRFDAPGGEFTLATRIDRIEEGQGALAIIDYKTGTPPTKTKVESGHALQLLLEAAMMGTPVHELAYWKLSGESNEARPVAADNASALASRALDHVKALVAAFDREETPYLIQPSPEVEKGFNDYEHLERRAEWEGACA